MGQCRSYCVDSSMKSWGLLSCLLVTLVTSSCKGAVHTEAEIAAHLAGDYDRLAAEECTKLVTAYWNHSTDLNNVTKKETVAAQSLLNARFHKEQWEEWFRDADWANFQEPLVKRQVKSLSKLGFAALDEALITELNSRSAAMQTVYSTAKICPYDNQQCDLATAGLELDPAIVGIVAQSKDYDELTYIWKAWRDAAGAKIRDDYKRYVAISNQGAVANGYVDMGEMWRDSYESDTFVSDVAALWKQVEPLYLSLHSYVRGKLVTRYGDRLGPDDNLIPAHVLGDMWGQYWTHLYDIAVPYPDASPVNVTAALIEQGYDVLRMFQTSNDFYLSLGLLSSDMSYNESLGAMLTRPPDREVVCHASAWDLCDKTDFRISMCAKVRSEDFDTIHHEMGHIQYYLQYRHQPFKLRSGPNPGFHEAIGDSISLSVSTPQHLQKIGLLVDYVHTHEAGINALLLSALDKVAGLPFAYLVDKWRWEVFNGTIPETEWNSRWRELREEIQRIRAPVERTESDFDPGALYHVADGSQYIEYFVALILQFQFHKALCIEAGHYNPDDVNSEPLYKCDIYQSTAAGTLLANGLKLGNSQHWSETLFLMTGQRKLDGSALLEYFAPLQDFLNQQLLPTT